MMMRTASRLVKTLWFSVSPRCCSEVQIIKCPTRTIFTGRDDPRLGNPDLPEPQDVTKLNWILGKWFERQTVRYQTSLQRAGMLSAMDVSHDRTGNWFSLSREQDVWTCKVGKKEVDQTQQITFKLNKFIMLNTPRGLPMKIIFTQDGERLLEHHEMVGDPEYKLVISYEAVGNHMNAIHLKNDLVSMITTYVKD